MADLKRKKLLAKAEKNTGITLKDNKSGTEDVLKKGAPLDQTTKHDPKSSPICVGMSKGVTKNMDNYESLRVDVWLSDTPNEGESIADCFTRVEAIIDETLEKAVLNTIS